MYYHWSLFFGSEIWQYYTYYTYYTPLHPTMCSISALQQASTQNSDQKLNLDLKNYWLKKIFGSNKDVSPKKFGLKRLVQNNFVVKNIFD